ncbi:hypothetical protein DQ04_02591030 [Trypanosoma grayi]|uniref:hypothetical protein n=1 Tax=Trypanosoma grayi TaxID=71804 RepID=UPI0004F4371F|nr:hypothetical protein DQ04_02591030 [Trypanosoma grayi]KEG11465.1 hypothetical protein DQ04_02591030 [Trypanosoma grayi]
MQTNSIRARVGGRPETFCSTSPLLCSEKRRDEGQHERRLQQPQQMTRVERQATVTGRQRLLSPSLYHETPCALQNSALVAAPSAIALIPSSEEKVPVVSPSVERHEVCEVTEDAVQRLIEALSTSSWSSSEDSDEIM